VEVLGLVARGMTKQEIVRFSMLRAPVHESEAQANALPCHITRAGAVRLRRFEAPVEVLGKASAPVRFRPALSVRTELKQPPQTKPPPPPSMPSPTPPKRSPAPQP
jgi:hypothetical protein